MVISLGTQIYLSNALALKGDRLTELEYTKAELEKEISKLELTKSELSSLAYVEALAKDQGYTEIRSQVIALKSPTLSSAISISKP